MDTDKKTSGTPLKIFSVGSFHVGSNKEIELHQKYNLVSGDGLTVMNLNLVSGDGLTVMNLQGNVVYHGLRGFSPLSEQMHLLRYEDGRWVLFLLDKNKERRLSKVNLRFPDVKKCLFFDERGKMHYDQASPYCPDINIK